MFVVDLTHPGSLWFDTFQEDSSDKQVVWGASVENIVNPLSENVSNSPVLNSLQWGTSDQPSVGESEDVFITECKYGVWIIQTYSDTRIIREPAMVITAQRTVRMVTMMVHIVSYCAGLKNK